MTNGLFYIKLLSRKLKRIPLKERGREGGGEGGGQPLRSAIMKQRLYVSLTLTGLSVITLNYVLNDV